MRLRQSTGAVLVERGGQGQGVGAGVRDAEHLQNGRHPRLARPADALALGEVENEVGRIVQQATEHLWPITEWDGLVPQCPEHRGDGLDGGGAVELFLKVVRDVHAGRQVGFQIVGDADFHLTE